jgi:hypothetical protein
VGQVHHLVEHGHHRLEAAEGGTGTGEDPRQPDQRLRRLPRHAHQGRGESQVRINLVGAWRETTVYTEAERAALELTEQGTRLADSSGVTDEAWSNAAKHFDEDQLMALVALICAINAFNRLNVITRTPGGEYQPGQFG